MPGLLKERGIERVDLVSLDIEGAEIEVLRCFPFASVRVDLWLVEIGTKDPVAMDAFFHWHGYVKAETFTGRLVKGKFLDVL